MSPEVLALVVLLGGVVAAVAFTVIVVLVVDRSVPGTRPPGEGDGADEREGGKREDEER